jgi:predicted enzyme related to lactoylglutathione lyase
MPKFVHIDIAADDPQRAADFFSKVFGWSVQKLEGPIPYWLLSTSPSSKDESAIGAGVACREEPWQSVTPTIDVPSADEYADKITAAGGAIVKPKTLISGVGHLVTFKDTEGNVFAILEPVASNPFASS